MTAILVADIGGSNIRLGLYRQGDACELLATVPTPAHDWDAFRAAIEAAARPHVREAAALSISIAGLVVPETGEVIASNLPGLRGHALAAELEALLGLPVVVTNDADCAALAEASVGAGVGHGVVFCAILGTGVGGGLVVDGKLVRGAGGLTGEWGHAPIVNEALVKTGDGREVRVPRFRCGCGLDGCADTIGGARGLERLHSFLHQRELNSHQILEAWSAGDALAAATVAAYIELLSGPLAMAVNLTGASVVPVFGGLGRNAALIAVLDVAVRRQILRRSDQPLVIPSRLTDQAGLVGAAYAFDGVKA